MPRLLPRVSPIGQMGQRVVRQGYQGKEEGFFGSEFTAKDLSDVFALGQQGINLVKEAEPIADYFTKKSAEADKQAALKEIAEKRAGINAQKAAQIKLQQEQAKTQKEIGQQNAENRQLIGMMPEVPDTALQEPSLGSGLAEPTLSLRANPSVIDSQRSNDFLKLKDQGYDDATAIAIASAGRDAESLPRPQTPMQLNVDTPGPVDPSAMMQGMRPQRQPVAAQQQPAQGQRLVQAAQQLVGRGPAGARMRKDGYFSHTPNKAALQALSQLEKERQLEPGTLQNIYLGSVPRYTAGTPGQTFPSAEFLELKNPYELSQYRPLVKTVEEAALFQELMETAIQREGGYGFLGKFDRQDELRKYFDKNFGFQGKIDPKEVKEGKGIGFGDARKIIGKKKRVPTGGGGGGRNQELYEDNILVVNEITAKMPDGGVQKQQAHDMSEEYLGYQARLRSVGKKQARKEIADKLRSSDPAQVEEAKAALGMETGATNKAALRRLSAFSNATSKRINKARKEGNKGNIKGTASLVQRGQTDKDKAEAIAKHRQDSNARADRTYNLNVSKFNASAVKAAKDRAHQAGKVAYDSAATYDRPELKEQRYQAAYDKALETEMKDIASKPVVPVDGTSGRRTVTGKASITEDTAAE